MHDSEHLTHSLCINFNAAMGFQGDILSRHNQLRKQLADGQVPGQPSASDIGPLKYSCALEKLAEGWSEFMCKNNHWDHNPNRKITSQHLSQCSGPDLEEGTNAGENLWMSSGSANMKTVVSGVDAWFNEHVDYTYVKNQSPGECTPGKKCGHYTQVIWSKTTHVGCAWKVCAGGQTYLVCNYAPAGNMAGRFPYEKGGAFGGFLTSGEGPIQGVELSTRAFAMIVIAVASLLLVAVALLWNKCHKGGDREQVSSSTKGTKQQKKKSEKKGLNAKKKKKATKIFSKK